jgi:hypothetical protein
MKAGRNQSLSVWESGELNPASHLESPRLKSISGDSGISGSYSVLVPGKFQDSISN